MSSSHSIQTQVAWGLASWHKISHTLETCVTWVHPPTHRHTRICVCKHVPADTHLSWGFMIKLIQFSVTSFRKPWPIQLLTHSMTDRLTDYWTNHHSTQLNLRSTQIHSFQLNSTELNFTHSTPLNSTHSLTHSLTHSPTHTHSLTHWATWEQLQQLSLVLVCDRWRLWKLAKQLIESNFRFCRSTPCIQPHQLQTQDHGLLWYLWAPSHLSVLKSHSSHE